VRIAFFNDGDHTVETAYEAPLGGSWSGLCYLAEQLAARGEEVFIMNRTRAPGRYRGVECLNLASDAATSLLAQVDAFVVQNTAVPGPRLRTLLPDSTRLVLWSGHADDQPVMQALADPAKRAVYDGFAYVSDWQRECYESRFALPRARGRVLRNAVGSMFESLFAAGESIVAAKDDPPVLAYTSTPYRGLHVLLFAFPIIRRAIPGATLKIFSGMSVYQAPEADADYKRLYQACRAMEGAELTVPVAQPALAAELRRATALAYPNTFPETSCIAVLEAMAAGAHVVTSDLAALPETTAGFARLTPVPEDARQHGHAFAAAMIEVLTEAARDPAAAEARLRSQVDHVNALCRWSDRAGEWVDWLAGLTR